MAFAQSLRDIMTRPHILPPFRNEQSGIHPKDAKFPLQSRRTRAILTRTDVAPWAAQSGQKG